ncbi:MAG: hypothetical protein U0Q55_06955 [Vicinamibacterales bacterium]
MTEQDGPPAQPALLRHIAPVLAGGVLIAMLTVVTGNWLNAHGWVPDAAQAGQSTGFLLFVLAYQALFAVIGSHMASRLAPAGQPRIRYALAVGFLLSIVSIISALQTTSPFPTWYLLAGIVLPIPSAIVGGGTATRAMAQGPTP